MQRFMKIDGVEDTKFDLRRAEVTAFITKDGPTPERLIKECEEGRDVMSLLKGPVCHSGFKRLN